MNKSINKSADKKIDPSHLSSLISLWEKSVEVQMHFNDIELRIRNIAVTILTTIIGAAFYVYDKNIYINSTGQDHELTGLLLFFACIPWLLFYSMDRFWYHRFLSGASKHVEVLEKRINRELKLDNTLSMSISKSSPIKTTNGNSIDSSNKIDLFYGIIFTTLIILGSVLV